MLRFRIRPRGPGRNTALIPDPDSYRLLDPSFLPGLEKTFTLPEWNIEETFFEITSKEYDTSFGMRENMTLAPVPVLYFNIAIVRNLIDALIRNMTPLIIVSLFLFAVMFISTEEGMSKTFSLDIGENLVFIGSMYFILIFAHISTRGRVPTQEIFYLEYSYLIMYVALLCVPLSTVLLLKGSNVFWVQHRDNLVLKLLYWPVILGTLFVVTIAAFY